MYILKYWNNEKYQNVKSEMVFDLTYLLSKEAEDKLAENKIAVEKRKIYHIVKNENSGWDLKEKDSSKIIESSFNKEELIRNAMKRCQEETSELIIHDNHGIIEEKRIYEKGADTE